MQIVEEKLVASLIFPGYLDTAFDDQRNNLDIATKIHDHFTGPEVHYFSNLSNIFLQSPLSDLWVMLTHQVQNFLVEILYSHG